MRKIYIDQDGVLAKFSLTATIPETHEEGFFLSREPEWKMIHLVKKLIARGFYVCVLSAAYRNRYAPVEKSKWIDIYLNKNVNRIFVPYGDSKSDYISCNDGSILIDDYSENLRAWEESGGMAVKFYNGINGTKGTWKGKKAIDLSMSIDDMISYLESL